MGGERETSSQGGGSSSQVTWPGAPWYSAATELLSADNSGS